MGHVMVYLLYCCSLQKYKWITLDLSFVKLSAYLYYNIMNLSWKDKNRTFELQLEMMK